MVIIFQIDVLVYVLIFYFRIMVCCWDIGYGNYIRIMSLLLNVCYFIVLYVKLKDLKIFVIENKLFFFLFYVIYFYCY